MQKQILTAAAIAALATGCGATRETTSSSSTSTSTTTSGGRGSTGTSGTSGSGGTIGGSGTTGGTTAGTTGSTGTFTCGVNDLVTMRTAPNNSGVCASSLTAVMVASQGNTLDGGSASQFSGNYFLVDSSSNAVFVYKDNSYAALNPEPVKGTSYDMRGTLQYFPTDAGSKAIPEVTPGFRSNQTLSFVDKGAGSATALTPTAAQLSATGTDDSFLGKYVVVPAGTYTVETNPDEFKFAYRDGGFSATSNGLAITSGTDRILVDTYTMRFSTGNCVVDGGAGLGPTIGAGGFKGVFEYQRLQTGVMGKVVYYGNCGQ